ncbi:MAG: NrfD/PsrC family molybdoenzyme membrane anchor subunit [Nitrospinota bacterium]
MKTGNPFTVRLVMEPKPQTVWGLNHATWFYAMGVGGALYLLRVAFGVEVGTVFGLSLAHLLGQLFIGVGGLILIVDLGKPFRFWRALMNPKTSWISVGAIGDFVFLLVDGLYILPDLEVGGARPLAWMPWANVLWVGVMMQVIAGAAAFLVIVYPGLVLATCPGIPLWKTMLIPLQYLVYAAASALGVVLLLASAGGVFLPVAPVWTLVEGGLLACCLLLVGAHLMEAWNGGETARLSVKRLFRGQIAPSFLWGCLVVGTAAPLGMSLGAFSAKESVLRATLLVIAGLLAQVGNFYSKYCIIKAAMYKPTF